MCGWLPTLPPKIRQLDRGWGGSKAYFSNRVGWHRPEHKRCTPMSLRHVGVLPILFSLTNKSFQESNPTAW